MSLRPCPMCGAVSADAVARQAFAAMSTPGIVNAYDVVCCRRCGFGYADGLPGPEQFELYYAQMSKYEHAPTGGLTSAPDQQRCEAIARQVSSVLKDAHAPILDVGCSTGALLGAFRALGYQDLEGLDPSPACASIAAELHGVKVATGTASDLPRLRRRYAAVLFSAVLEHLLDPLTVLRDARPILERGGLVFVEVPDVEAFAECAVAPYQEFSIEHINYFSLESLTSMFGLTGFECVDGRHVRLRWTSGVTAPAIHAVFRCTDAQLALAVDAVTRPALLEYVAVSERIEETVRSRIKSIADRGRPVLIWGVGTHTRHLLEAGALDGLQIAAYVDSEPKYQGAELGGVPVLAPSAVAGRGEPIIVSSGTLHHEIARQIIDQLGADTEIVLLYD